MPLSWTNIVFASLQHYFNLKLSPFWNIQREACCFNMLHVLTIEQWIRYFKGGVLWRSSSNPANFCAVKRENSGFKTKSGKKGFEMDLNEI